MWGDDTSSPHITFIPQLTLEAHEHLAHVFPGKEANKSIRCAGNTINDGLLCADRTSANPRPHLLVKFGRAGVVIGNEEALHFEPFAD